MSKNGYRDEYWGLRALEIAEKAYGDPEIGHSEEDKLLAEFVRAVADGLLSDPKAAAEAIRDRLLDAERTRWYA